jgi:hypothetical protein
MYHGCTFVQINMSVKYIGLFTKIWATQIPFFCGAEA